MVIIGIDAHKYTHTVVAVDAQGRQLGTKTIGTTTADHLALLSWAGRHDEQLLWAVEDCRQLSRRLERDLLAAGQRIVRVPPKLMTNMRDAARSFGKSDPIDALAVARAALREPDLPIAQLDGPERDVRLLVDLWSAKTLFTPPDQGDLQAKSSRNALRGWGRITQRVAVSIHWTLRLTRPSGLELHARALGREHVWVHKRRLACEIACKDPANWRAREFVRTRPADWHRLKSNRVDAPHAELASVGILARPKRRR